MSSISPAPVLAKTPKAPYYAVIFSSVRTEADLGYDATAKRMVELAAQQPGYLGVESARDTNRLGITVSYWRDLESITNWKQNSKHLEAQRGGKRDWYEDFTVRIARVEREYSL